MKNELREVILDCLPIIIDRFQEDRLLLKKTEACKKLSVCDKVFDREVRPFLNPVMIGKQERYELNDLLRYIREKKIIIGRVS